MSPEFPLEILKWFFQFDKIGPLLGIMALYAIFRGWHYLKLLSGDPEKHKPVFEEASHLIRSEHWGTRYRVFLQKILAKLTGAIGDHYRFPDEPPEKPRLQAGDPALEQLHKQDTLRRVLGVNPFTVESYQFCFLLALFYPILSFMVGWVIGGNGVLGDLNIMPDDLSFLMRLGVLTMLLLSLIAAIWSTKLSGWKSILAAAAAAAAAGAFAFTGAVAGAFAGSVAAALPWYIFFPLVLGLVFTLFWLYEKAQQKSELATYWFIYSLVFLTASLAALNWIENTSAVLVLLFYLILTLVNTPLDWLSLGITRALLQSIRFNQHRLGKALLWSLLDLGLAIVALLLVSGVTVSVVSLANLLAIKPIIDLQALFTSLSSLDNWKDNLWIYFMLLSTLIPTAVHFALAGGAVTLAVSNKQRRAILKDIETNDLSAKKAWIYVSVMPAFGFVLAPTLLLFGLYLLLHSHGAWLGNALLAWAEMLAIWIDPTLGQLP